MKDTQYMTGKEKEMVLKQWITFIKNGFKFEHFTDRLYKHLTLHCSFIAHFDRVGFFNTYFIKPERKRKFIGQFDTDKGMISIEYGDNYWLWGDYDDLNLAMCSAMEQCKESIYKESLAEERSRDITEAQSLLLKWGIKFKYPKGK